MDRPLLLHISLPMRLTDCRTSKDRRARSPPHSSPPSCDCLQMERPHTTRRPPLVIGHQSRFSSLRSRSSSSAQSSTEPPQLIGTYLELLPSAARLLATTYTVSSLQEAGVNLERTAICRILSVRHTNMLVSPIIRASNLRPIDMWTNIYGCQ